MDRYAHVGVYDLAAAVNALPTIARDDAASESNALQPTGTDYEVVLGVPTMVPRGAENSAVVPASLKRHVARVCTEREEIPQRLDAATSQTPRTTDTKPQQSAAHCIENGEESKEGAARIRTGDNGFAIRCLSPLGYGAKTLSGCDFERSQPNGQGRIGCVASGT